MALAVFAGTLGYVRSQLLADPDTYWHIAAGRWMFQHLTVPTSDPFSHTILGAPWVAHEWLSEVVLAATYSAAGWTGVVVLTVLLFAGTLTYLTRFLLSRMEPAHALLLVAMTGSLLAGHLLARPHVLTWPLMAVWVGTLVDRSESGRGPPWWALGLIVLWANLHGGVTLGVVLGVALAFEAVLVAPTELRKSLARRWGAFVALSLCATMLTPWGWKLHLLTFQLLEPNVIRDAIGEWRPMDFRRFQPLELWLLLILGIALTGRLRLRPVRLLLLLGLVHLALIAVRNASVLGLASPFLIATSLGEGLRAGGPPGRDAESLDRLFRTLAAPARPLAMVAASVLATVLAIVAVRTDRYVPPADQAPEAAITAALNSGARGPVLNDYDFGGYLIFRGIPVFIDGRADDMYGRTFMESYIRSLKEPETLARIVVKYDIAWTLLRPGSPAVSALDTMQCWRRVHSDSLAVVHVRDC